MKVSFQVFKSHMKSWADLCGKRRRSHPRRGRNASSNISASADPARASSSSGTGTDGEKKRSPPHGFTGFYFGPSDTLFFACRLQLVEQLTCNRQVGR